MDRKLPRKDLLCLPFYISFIIQNYSNICNRPGTNAAGMGFVDDVNILAYGKSTEENCKTLQKILNDCERWAARHGSVFAPHKYELIYLAKNPKAPLTSSNDNDDNDDTYSDMVAAEGRPMRASLSSFIVHGKPFEEEILCNPVSGRGPSGSQPCAP